MDSYILRYCLICDHHVPELGSGMDIYCGKQKSLVFNYNINKCRQNNYFRRTA